MKFWNIFYTPSLTDIIYEFISYNFNDNIINTKKYFYNKKNYFWEILNNINNNEILDANKEVINDILKLINEEIIIINTYNIRSLLKEYNYNWYYKYIPYLIRKWLHKNTYIYMTEKYNIIKEFMKIEKNF